jgi:hypothetical protein
LEESFRDVPNPGRGWYRIAPYNLAQGLEGKEFLTYGDEKDRVVLARVELSEFRNRDLTREAIDRLDSIISQWAKLGRDVVLRCCYDVHGLGYEREPFEFSRVVRHVHQVGEVIRSHEREIMVYQGLLVGSWGEMHHSRYLSDLRLRELYMALRSSAGPNIPVALRTPRHIRQVLGGRKLHDAGPLGIFDDGMMGSSTDLATFGTDASGVELPRGSWRRTDELERLGRFGRIVPLGGEAVGTSEFSRPSSAYDYLRKVQVTYLNRTHDPATISRWVRTRGERGWPSAFEYFGAHLGYRLVCTSVRLYEQGNTVACQVVIANKGFARPFFEIDATLIAREESRKCRIAFAMAAGSWDSGKEVHLLARVPSLTAGTHLYLELRRKLDGALLMPANTDAREALPLGVWC